MFRKKICKKCGRKVNEKHDFCQYCGNYLRENRKENWGMLGKTDRNDFDVFSESLFGGIGGKVIGKMFNSAMKALEKEMQKETKRSPPETSVQLFINGKRIDLGNQKQKTTGITKVPLNLSGKSLKKFSSLPREEPKTDVRRLGDRVIYEVNIPGVVSINDISIVTLENSIEIKAVGKNKAYLKIIPINLPMKNYNFSKGKLVLELGTKN